MTASRLRSPRRRAALLTAVWVLSGLWSVAHALAHEMEHDVHHSAAGAERSVVPMAASHGHVHLHPDSLPVVSAGKSPTVETPALVSFAPEIDCERAPFRWCARAAAARASPRLAAASGPRAPPVS